MANNYYRKKKDPIERKIMMALFSSVGKLLVLPFKKIFPNFFTVGTIDPQKILSEFRRIEELTNGSKADCESAIIHGDRLLDHVLKTLSQGQTMGERLKNAQGKFLDYDSYQAAWEAHKVRNRLAHEIGHGVDYLEAKGAIERYRRALRGLGVL